MGEDLGDHGRVEDGGDDRQGAAAVGAMFDVDIDTFTRTDTDKDTGEEIEKEIPYFKAYTVFNVAQIDGLPAHTTKKFKRPFF